METAEEWAKRQFEFEYCDECHGDVEDHDYVLLLGNWFAKCKKEHVTRCHVLGCNLQYGKEGQPID